MNAPAMSTRSNASLFAVAGAALAGALAAAPGCGGNCGTVGAPLNGFMASGSGSAGVVSLQFGQFKSSANNDCPDPGGAPKGVVSLTIEGTQFNGSGALVLCIPRPDLLETQSQPLGSGGSDVQFLGGSFTATLPGCSYALDMTMSPSGTVKAQHECNDGTNAAGFDIEVDGTLPLIQTCGANMASVTVTTSGTTAVVPGNF
jgi:hypothetical protein